MEEKVRAIVADVLHLDPRVLDASTSRDNNQEWDSLAHINMVVALEQEFGVSFDVAEIESMFTLDDVVRIMQTKGPN